MHQTSREYIRTISVMHFLFIASIVMLGIITCLVYLSRERSFFQEWNQILIFSNPLTGIIAGVISLFTFKQNIASIRNKSTLKLKLDGYKTVLIKFLTINEVAILITYLSVYLTGNFWHLISVIIPMGFILLKRPTIQSVIRDLDLNQVETSILENPDSKLQ